MTGNGNRARPLKVLLSAVEPSGDALGADLIKALRTKTPGDIEFFGCGGPQMAAVGFQSAFSIDKFSVMGPVSALGALPEAFRRTNQLAQLGASREADAAILIDGWSFSRLAAKKIRQTTPNTKIFKFVAPQVWASRPHRVETVKALFDGVVALFEFEKAWFERAGVRVASVGNPVFQSASHQRMDGCAFREKHRLGAAPVLAILLGSRSGEVRRLAGPFAETVKLLCAEHPELRIVSPLAPVVADEARAQMAGWPGEPLFVESAQRFEAFAAADAALAASGTVTTELAISATPMAVAYKVHPLSAMWVRRIVTTDFASLVNVAAGHAIVPEFLQEDCQPNLIAPAISALLNGGAAREAQIEAFPLALEKLGVGGPPAGELAAEAILSWLQC